MREGAGRDGLQPGAGREDRERGSSAAYLKRLMSRGVTIIKHPGHIQIFPPMEPIMKMTIRLGAI